ncbi:glycosyltransferase [Pectinatus frisingensis]|nr:glycosyltransferase [Pectinatus frisingensis]
MADSLKVSVITAMHNADEYIIRAVDSILAQSLEDIEIIIIDDYSTDGCAEKVAKYYQGITNIHLFSNTGISGPGFCRNIGLSHAHGEYIAFVDSDDFIDRDFLKKLYEMANYHAADIAVCGYDKITEKSLIRSYQPSCGLHKGGIGLADDLSKIEFVIWNKLYRRSLIENNAIRFQLSCYGEDWLFCFKAMFAADYYVCSDESLYFYYQHYDSVSHKKINQDAFRQFYDFFIYLDEYLQEQPDMPVNLQQQIEQTFFFAVISCYIVPFYRSSTAADRSSMKIMLFQQFGQGGLHFQIVLDAFLYLYDYVVKNERSENWQKHN